jgi:flagellar biosynthesis protein FlhA
MAIDADLGAGMITEKEARERRKAVQREADFHGAMDGASKFVRGDAIAGLLVLVVNVVGGIIIGVAQKGLSVGHAAELYTVLSIGDGLVAQIPALLVSTGAALLTTRGDDAELGSAMRGQLLARKRPLAVTAAVLFCIGLLPGMPHIVFFVLGGTAAYLATRAKSYADTAAAVAASQADAGTAGKPGAGNAKSGAAAGSKAEIESALPVELLGLEVGFELVSMVDASAGGELLHRVATLRKQLAGELGVIVPPLHIQDDLRLRPGGYRVLLSGVAIGTGEVHAHRVLAIDPSGMALKALTGEPTTEPTFGLPAKWIAPSDRLRAEAAGCTVVDSAAVVATHLTELLRRNAHELLGRREVQELLDVAGKHDSKVIEELIPHLMPISTLIHVLRNLLREGVSIRDLRTILEALADHAHAMKNPDDLTEVVRQRLARRITKSAVAADGTLRPLVLDPRAEQILRDGGRNPAALSRLTDEIAARARDLASRDETPLLVVSPDLRRALAGIAARHVPGLVVMSYREVDPNVRLVTRGVISAQEAA